MSKIICIDPGHGGVDVGAVRGNRYEKSDNLRMAKAVKALLEAQGIKVVLTRDGDSNPALSTRCSTANKANADYFLSIHRNSFGNQNATGAEIWVHHAAQQSTVDKAQRILDEVLAVCGKDRGVKKGYTGNPNADYAINRESKMASALLELLFISSDYDNGLYDRYFDKLAVAVAKGLCAAVGVTYGDKKPDAPVGGSYIVKSGDSFWKIAAEQLGDGNRYKELAAFNGLSANSVIHAGDVLKIPKKNSEEKYHKYIVKPNDSFWKIASEQMGCGAKYKELAKFNGMTENSVIHPGDVLKIPKKQWEMTDNLSKFRK